jgi:hypothetical protein
MRSLRWVGLVFSLLIVGVLGGLMAPLPSGAAALGSESLPIVTIYEVKQGTATTFNIARGGSNCTNSNVAGAPFPTPANYQCYSLTAIPFPTTINAANGRWRVGSYASNSQARVYIKDSDSATDNMYITGISITPLINTANPISVNSISPACTFPPTASATCQHVHLTLQKTFDLGAGNNPGAFYWAVHAGGNFNAPDFTENVVLDRMRITSLGCFSALNCNPDTASDRRSVGTGDTNPIYTPITAGGQGGININTGPTQFGTCDTGGKCRPTIKYDYEITIRGFDTMNDTDSQSGCGGTCIPGFFTNGTLPPCGDADTPPTPPSGPSLLYQCKQQLKDDNAKDDESNEATGGVPAEACGSTCIVILLKGTPPGSSAGAGPFTFTTTGDGVNCPSPCQVTLNSEAVAVKGFGNLEPDPTAGDRTFIITDFPPGGDKGDFQLDQVTNDGTGCTFVILTQGTKNNKTKIGATVTNLEEGAQCILGMHVH